MCNARTAGPTSRVLWLRKPRVAKLQAYTTRWLRVWKRSKRRHYVIRISFGLLAAAAAIAPLFLMTRQLSAVTLETRGYSLRPLPSEQEKSCSLLPQKAKDVTYVFLHLHKTAGNNLKNALFAFAKQNELSLYHTCHPSRADSILESIWFSRSRLAGSATACNVEELASMPAATRSSFDLIVGHQYFGVHRIIPHRDVRYFTIVRHPLARKVSHYAHFESAAADNANGTLDAAAAQALPYYLTHRNRNYMVKRLSAATLSSEIAVSMRSWYIDHQPYAGDAVLRQAKRHLLHRFFFVGVQERYSESVCVLAKLLNEACYTGKKAIGNKPLVPGRIIHSSANYRGQTQRLIAGLAQEERIAALNSDYLDMDLYRFANHVLDERLLWYPMCRGYSSAPVRRRVGQSRKSSSRLLLPSFGKFHRGHRREK